MIFMPQMAPLNQIYGLPTGTLRKYYKVHFIYVTIAQPGWGTWTLQTHHMYSTLIRRGNGRFHVVSTWNTHGVFVGNMSLQAITTSFPLVLQGLYFVHKLKYYVDVKLQWQHLKINIKLLTWNMELHFRKRGQLSIYFSRDEVGLIYLLC